MKIPCILITNDDGIDAKGLETLAKAARQLTDELWIVAPKEDQSGASQKISLRQPLRVEERGERRFAVDGTPSDCVAIASSFLMKNNRPSFVISGVNATSNIGDELALSGTAGAALTAMMQGIPSLAISQEAFSRSSIPWNTTEAILPALLKHLLSEGWSDDVCPSINIPDLPPEKIKGFRWVRQGSKNIRSFNIDKRTSPRSEDYFWLYLHEQPCQTREDDEQSALKRGEVSIVAMTLDRSVPVNKPFVQFNGSDAG